MSFLFQTKVEEIPLLEITSSTSYLGEFFLSAECERLKAKKSSIENEIVSLENQCHELKKNSIYRISKIGQYTFLLAGSIVTTTGILTGTFVRTTTGIIAQVGTGIFLGLCSKIFPFFVQKWAGIDIIDQIDENKQANICLQLKFMLISNILLWAKDINIFFHDWEMFSQNPSREAIPNLLNKFNNLTNLHLDLGFDQTLLIKEIIFFLNANEQESVLKEYKIKKESFDAFCKERDESIIEIIKKRYQVEFGNFFKEDSDLDDEAIKIT